MAELKRTVSLIIRENAGIDNKENELYLNHTFPHFNPDLTDEELQTLGREYAELFYGCRDPVGRLLSYDLDGGAEERISEDFIRSWMSEVMTSKLFEQDTGNEPVKIPSPLIT